MNRLALRRLLRGLVVAALPLGGSGCGGNCPPSPHNEFVPLPDGGIRRSGIPAPIHTPLTEEECARPCGWNLDAGVREPNDGGLIFDRWLVHECRITEEEPGTELAVF